MRYKNLVLYLVFFFSAFSYAQNIEPISEIKHNDANGVPLDTGKVYTITGIVTSSNQFGTSGPGSIQDKTAGLSLYGSSFVSKINIGDSIIVTGVLSQYSGNAELDDGSGSSIQVISSNHSIKPEVVTIDEIQNQQWNDVEEFEGKLVEIDNVTILGSGTFGGNKAYDISDTTGTLPGGLWIDADVGSVVGVQIPSGKVDIIGILTQYKYSPPYNSGYQIGPRFIQDIVGITGPVILTPIIAADVDTNSFTVYFNTYKKGDTKIKYGLTKTLELDSIYINNDTTHHHVKINDLKPSTTYYYKVFSSDTSGTSSSDIQSVVTASANPSLGTINVYFNFPVDTTVALPGNAAHGNVNFEDKLINRINRATYSIDMALYSFSGMPDVANALIAAKDRGVKIRVVYDSRIVQNSMQQLINAGIQIIQRPASLTGIMHNKFFIFDERDTIATNDWLWTGSWNVTSTELGWKNNVVEINDPTITQAYETEFEEMWGSDNDTPNAANAKFGPEKSDNTPHSFSIGNRPIYLYFSPSDGTTSKIIDAVNTANDDIFFAQFTFTRNDISQAIYNMYKSGAADIRGVIDQINDNGSEYTYLSGFADMHANAGATLHSKYGIIDAEISNSDPIVITGSHNWSTAAETENDENTLIIHDPLIANQYLQDFKKRYNDAGGTGAFMVPTAINDKYKINKFSYKLFQNYPNPFNPVTTIKFELPKAEKVTLSIYDILGRRLKTLFDGNAPAGVMAIDFNADGLSSGIYFYRVKTDDFAATKKLILMK
jgi:phosphatidylserine/phosphatidylglycerophosphate/cardiolipin synthase-like enzyme